MSQDSDIATPKKEWQQKFVAALLRDPNITRAAKKAGVNRQWAYKARETDADFAKAWDDALGQAIDSAEAELYRRSVTGVLKPVYHLGKRVGSIREYSDTLLIFLLKAHKPERYRDAVKVMGSGPNGEIEQKHSGTVNGTYDLTKLSIDELLAFRTLAMKAHVNPSPG